MAPVAVRLLHGFVPKRDEARHPGFIKNALRPNSGKGTYLVGQISILADWRPRVILWTAPTPCGLSHLLGECCMGVLSSPVSFSSFLPSKICKPWNASISRRSDGERLSGIQGLFHEQITAHAQ